MLGENIKILRKEKGYSQETLAAQLHVVRQTVSKWEKGISVPDAQMLNQIAELLEVPVSTLLGDTVPSQNQSSQEDSRYAEIAKQLAVLNDQLAEQSSRKRRNFRRGVVTIVAVLFLFFAVYLATFIIYGTVKDMNQELSTTSLTCTLNDETYLYEITYNQNYQITSAGGDSWIADHVQTEKYEDANVLIAQIQDYFTDRGGTCEIELIDGNQATNEQVKRVDDDE